MKQAGRSACTWHEAANILPFHLWESEISEFGFAGFEAAKSTNVWRALRSYARILGERMEGTEEVPAGQFF